MIVNGDHPDLGSFVQGQCPTPESIATADHLEACAECRNDLVEVTLGHALLTATARTLPHPPAAVPPPVAVPARRRRLVPALAAAAAAVVLGGVGLALLDRGAEEPRSRTVAVPERVAVLEPVDGAAAVRGEVSMRGDGSVVTMTVDTSDLPRADQGRFYYAWLLDPETNKMLPLGQLGPSGATSFELPGDLVTAYTAIDVSLEDDDGDPGHSVTSVLRASYAADTPDPDLTAR